MQQLKALSVLAALMLLSACAFRNVTPSRGLAQTPSLTREVKTLSRHPDTPSPTPNPTEYTSPPGPVVLQRQDCVIDLAADGQGIVWSTCDGTVVTLADELGEARVLATGQRFARHIVLKGDDVFWIEGSDGATDGGFSITEVSRSGGETMRVTQDVARIASFAIDDTHLYWSTCPVGEGKLWRAVREGGAPTVLAETSCATSIGLSEEYVFWVDDGLRRAKKDGSAAEMLLPNDGLDGSLQPLGVGLRPEYHVVGIGGIIRIDEADVYLMLHRNNNPGMLSCTDNHSDLLRYSAENGTLSYWPGVASNAYVAQDEQGTVLLASADCWAPGEGIVTVSGTGKRSVVAVGDGRKGPIAANDSYIYWWNQSSRNLERMRK